MIKQEIRIKHTQIIRQKLFFIRLPAQPPPPPLCYLWAQGAVTARNSNKNCFRFASQTGEKTSNNFEL